MKSELIKWSFLQVLWISILLKVKVAQLCLTLCDPMDCTVHGILQARILEWVAFPFSRGSSQPRDWTQVSLIAGGLFTSWATREALLYYWRLPNTPFICEALVSVPGLPGGSGVKNPPSDAGDAGSIPGSGRSPRGGNGNPLQYACLENPMNRGAWWATVHRVTKSQIWLKWLATWQSSFLISQNGTESMISNKLRDGYKGTSKQEGWSKGGWAL